MTGNMKKTVASIFLFGSLSLSALASMTTMNGKSATLTDYMDEGKWTIVEVWHSKCNICMKSMPSMVKASGTFNNAKVVGISLDGKLAKAKRVVKRFDINFPTLLTSIDDFAIYLRSVSGKELVGVPLYLVFSPEGTLKAMQAGNISPTELSAYLNKLKKKNIVTVKQTLAEQIIANKADSELLSPE